MALLILLAGMGGGSVPPAVIGLAWLASSGLLWWSLVQAVRLYYRVLAVEGDLTVRQA